MKRLLSIATLAMLTMGVFAVAPAEARWRDNDRCGNNGFYNGNNNGNGFFNRRHNGRQMKRFWRNQNNRGWFNNNGNRFGLNTQARYW